jgi:hypothetical protein
LPADERGDVLRMLEPHRGMWDGRLGTVAATTHRIAVTPGSKPYIVNRIERVPVHG